MQAKRNPDQNRRIWGLVSQLGRQSGLGRDGAEDVMRLICREISGQERTSDLSPQQADRLILELGARLSPQAAGRLGTPTGGPSPKAGPGAPAHRAQKAMAPDPAATITRQQQAVLEHLYKDAGINNPKGFCERVIKKPWPQTRADANKLYQALEAMIVRKISRDEVQTILWTLLSLDFK